MRLALIPLLVLLAVPAVPALADQPDVQVTAVVQDATGHLTFRSEQASDSARGHRLAARWRSESRVVAADVEHRVHVTADPLEPRQWGLSALSAQTVLAGGDATGQLVAVIDSGVDARHPDLAGVVRPGLDLVDGVTDGRTDPNGHGTHVAGIVGAIGGNGVGGAGLARGAQILPVRVMDADGSGYDGDAARGLVWAADHGASVANLSFGGPDRSSVMDAAVGYALAKGVSVVVAAGNEGLNGDPVLWPAANDGVIAVGAVDATDTRPAWSSSGPHLDVVAPGVDIISTVPDSEYASYTGTSMAAPFVSAAAALLRGRSVLTPAGVRSRLLGTAVDLGEPGPDALYGAGRIDILAAMALPPVPADVVPAEPVLSARISASRSAVPYTSPVTISTRTLSNGLATGYLPVRLERRVGTSWLYTRGGTTGPDGLVSWVIRPDRTADYRIVGGAWLPPTLRVAVTPVVSMSRLLAGRVLPGAVAAVRLQQWRSTGWVTLVTVMSAGDGSFQFTRRLPAGTLVRAAALGAVSIPARL